MSFNIFGQPSDHKGTGQTPFIPPPIKIPDAIPVIPGSESKIHQCVIQRIMRETLESDLDSVKKIKASKAPSPSESVVSSFELLLSINDLFDQIVKQGGFTEEEIEELRMLREEIKNQKVLLSETENQELYSENKSQSYLNIAMAAVVELESLQNAMQETASLEDDFLNVLEAIEIGTFSQQFSGELLLLPDLFERGSQVLRQLWGKIYQYGEGSLARQSAEEMVEHGSKSLAFALSEWEDNAIESIKQQRNLLLKVWGEEEETEKNTSVALLASLRAQLTTMQKIFTETQKQLMDHPYLEAASSAVAQAHAAIGKELERINNALIKSKISVSEKALPYGREEWKELAGDRFPKLAVDKDESGWSLFHPERWSERSKRVVHSLLVGMQISQQAISAAQQFEQRGGSVEKTAEGASTAVGWFQTAIGKVTDAVKLMVYPEQYRIEHERRLFNQAEFKFAEETIASSRKELLRAIDQAKEDRVSDQLAALFKMDRDLEIVLKSKPAETASKNAVARWKSEVINLCDRAASQLFKMKRVSRQALEEVKPANEAEARALLSLQSFVETPSQLPPRDGKDSGKQLPDKVFQHILGDFFGKDTGLEGYASHEMLDYVLSLVSAKAASLKNNPLCQEDDKRDFCSDAFEVDNADISLEMFSKLERQLADAEEMQRLFEGDNTAWFVEGFKLRVAYLKPNESFFFLGGWQHKTAGHAVVYEVVRQQDGLLTFRIFNRGEGAGRYAQAMMDGTAQMMSFGEIVDISENSLNNLLFLHGLREMNVRPKENEEDWTNYDFYTKLLPILDGKISNRVYTKDQMMRWLQVGHCTYLSLTALMNFQLGDQLTYSHWEVAMQFKTFWDYFLQSQAILSKEEQPRRLLKEGLAQISRNLADARKQHIVSDAEAVWMGNQLKTLEIALITAEAESLKQVVTASPIVDIQPIDGPLSRFYMQNVRFNSPDLTQTKYVPTISKHLDRADWQYRPEQFISDLQSLLAETRDLTSLQITSAKLAIETMLNKVPISGDVFWKELSPAEAAHSLDMLGELARSYFTINAVSRDKFGENEMLFVEDNLAMIKILTVADALAKDFKDEWGFEFSNLCQVSMLGVLESRSTSSSISDPAWEEERRLMRDYWSAAPVKPFEQTAYVSFFGFENGYWIRPDKYKGASRVFHRFSDVPPNEQYPEEKLHWEDIEFAKNWVQRREIADKLPIDFKQLGDVHQAMLLLSEGYDRVPYALPPQFFSLKAISQALYYSHCKLVWDTDRYNINQYNVLFAPEAFEESGKDVVLIDQGRDNVYNEYNLNPVEKWKTVEYLNPLELTQGNTLHSPFLETLKSFAFMQTGKGELYQSYLVMRDRTEPHDRMIISYVQPDGSRQKIMVSSSPRRIQADRPFFETQELLSLSSVKSLQIQETFAYFSLNSHLLSERRYQEMFSYLMTENGLFIDELLKDPEQASQFVRKLAKFCKEQVRIHKERDDSGSMLFFLELTIKFSSLLDLTKDKHPGAFPQQFSSPFADVRRNIREVANNKNASNVDRRYAHYLSIVSVTQQQTLTESDIKDLVLGLIYFDIYGLPPNREESGVIKVDKADTEDLGALSETDDHRWDPSKIKRIREIIVKNHEALRNVLSDDVIRDRVLNEAVRFYDSHFVPQTWSPMPAYPYFESADGVYVMDMEKGALFIDGGGLRVFPKTERENTFVKYVLGDEQDTLVKRSVDGTLEFRDKSGNEYLFQGNSLYRKFGEQWFQAKDPSMEGVLGGSWSYRLIPRETSFIWQGLNQDNELPNVDSLLQRFSAYRSGEQIGPDHLVSYIEDIKTHRLTYKISEQRDRGRETAYRTKEIQLLDEWGNETGKVLTENYRSCYEFLRRVDKYEDIFIWQDKQTKHPFRIDLPRYDFSFSIKRHEGEWIALADKYPDLHLAKLQYVPQLGDISTYLVLEDDRGGKFALIPELSFEKLTVPLITETNLNQIESSKLFLQRINSDGSDIVPESREDRFKLASLFLWERDYERAMKYLRGYGALLSPLTESELKVLERMIDFPKINMDWTPEASAVRLYAHLLNKEEPSSKDIDTYSLQLDQLGNLRLKPDEEKQLGIEVQQAASVSTITSGMVLERPLFEGEFGLLDTGMKQVDFLASAISRDKADPYTKARNLRKREIYLGLEPTDRIPKGSVLRPNLHFSFVALYNLFKYHQFDEKSIVLFNDITGLELPSDTDPTTLMGRYRQLLTFVLMTTDELASMASKGGIGKYTNEQVLAATLLAVIDDPDAFPSLDLIMSQDNEERQQFVKNEKILEKVRQLWKAPPEMPQGTVQVVATAPSGLPTNQNIQHAPLTPAHLMSVQLKEGFPLQFSGAAHLDRVVEWAPPDPEEVAKIRNAGEALSKVFDLTVADPVAKVKYQHIQSKIAESAEKRIAASGHYRLKSVEALNALKAELLDKANQLEPILESQEQHLLAHANKPYDSEALEAERNARIAGRLEKRLSITELFHVFRTRDKEAIARRNPALSADEIAQIFEMIREHLETITLHQHQLRMLKLIADIEKKPGPVELQALVDEFSASAKANRQYDVVNHPEYLNLEQNGNILIRRDQVENLEKMAHSEERPGTTSRNGAALEAIPGSGKTSVLLIEQALNAADGEHLSLVVIPEALMPSMSMDIQETFGDAYGTLIELIGFDRNSPSDTASLLKIDDVLTDAITNKKVVLMTDKSIQSFFLEYIRKSYSFLKEIDNILNNAFNKNKAERTDENIQSFFRGYISKSSSKITTSKITTYELDKTIGNELKVMEEILRKFIQLGIATLDEIDLILDALRSHHFTIGSSQPLKLEVAEAVSGLYGFIATNSAIQKAIKFPFLPHSTGPAFTEQRYRDSILPILVGKVLDGTILGNDKDLQAFLKNLTKEERVLLETYLHAKKDPEAIAFFKGIESVKIKNILAILKEEINVLLPLTSSKNVNEHYGPMPTESGKGRSTKSDLSIPYRGSNNPVKGSEHGTDLEIVNHSIEMNMALGVKEHVVAKEIENIKTMTEEELTLRGARRLEECEGYAAFIKLCGGETKFNLFKLTEEDIKAITAIANKSPETKMELITKYIIPQVKTYPVELSSSGELYAFLLYLVKGFTGTLWNDESFPNIFYGAIESDTMAKTLNILWEKSPKAIPAIPLPRLQGTPSEHAKLLVDKLYSREGGFKGCFADSAGVFREIEDNSLVAKEILRHQPETIKGVVYYDQQGQLMVWTRHGEAVPLERSRLAKEELAAFWDQQHTTGSDIKLGLTMQGTVSVGRFTMMRDLIQSVWRMRGLEKGQQVDFVVNGEDLQVIRETLKNAFGREVGETLGLDNMFLYAMHMQMSRQGEDVYRTLKSKLNGVLIRKVMEVIANPGEPDVDKPKIIYATRSLFIDETVKEPYEVYGGIAEELDSATAVENELNKVLGGEAFKAFSTLAELSKRYSADAIKAELEAVAAKELAKSPPKVKQNTAYEKEVAVEVETEKETEKEKEKEKMKSKHKYTEGEQYTKPRPVAPWKREAVFSSKAYLPVDVAQIKGCSLEKIRSDGLSNVISVNPVLAGDLLTKDFGDFFDENLFSTLNFMPIYLPDSSKELIYHPFGRYHDVVSNLIVVESLETGAFKLVIGNQEDIKALDQHLADDLKKPKQADRDVRVCIYNLENGVIRQGSDRFDVERLEENKEFVRLKTQAKFFAGYVTYSPEEQKILREWFKEKGVERMQKFFREVVLAEKETRQAQYHRSTIQRVFDELITS